MDDAERIRRALPALPIFPLPGAVLLPNGLVPLHVFEPRYRKMTRDCAAGLRVLALANLPDEAAASANPPRVLPVIGVGVLARVDPLPDGRFNVVLRGCIRARIRRELTTSEPYRIVEAEELTAEPTGADLSTQTQALRQLIVLLSQKLRTRELAALAALVSRAQEPGDLADLIAGALLAEPRERQAALEAVDVEQRLELAAQAAAQALLQSQGATALN